jgi:undecaprenyl-diphosphatase
MHVLDLTLFYALYNLASHGAFIDSLIIFLGKYLLYIIGVFIAYVLFDANRKSDTKKVYGYVVAVLGALVARFFIGSSIRFFYHRPRPFVNRDILLVSIGPYDFSFCACNRHLVCK